MQESETKLIGILSSRGYSIKKKNLSLNEQKKIRKDLTVQPFVCANINIQMKPFMLYLESVNKLYMPRYYGIENFGKPKINKLSDSSIDIDIKFNGDLRDKQKPVVEAFYKAANDIGGGIIILPCGFGKTIIGLYILALLKKKCIIVVHKEFLMNQWKERIEEFLPDARVGIIQQNKIHIEDKDIVLAMLQSISMKEYPENTFDSFGTAIFDECHHLGAEVFSRALPKLPTKYSLGLSATPDRKDGLSTVFEWYLGKPVYSVKEREPDQVTVKLIEFDCNDPEYCKVEYNHQGRVNNPKMITQVCDYRPRLEIIIDELKKLVEDKRKILILSDRRNHLTNLKEAIDKLKLASTGYYVGGSKQIELKETEKKQVILGTFSMAAEGMDIKALNTIILASPKTDVEQSVGRIFRQKKDERTHEPLIIDIIDNIPLFKRQSTHRKRLYKKNKYTITKKIIKDGEENDVVKLMELKLDKCIIEDEE